MSSKVGATREEIHLVLKVSGRISSKEGQSKEIQDNEYKILDTGYWIQDTGYRILDTGYWI